MKIMAMILFKNYILNTIILAKKSIALSNALKLAGKPDQPVL
jgi:hypothetical protein